MEDLVVEDAETKLLLVDQEHLVKALPEVMAPIVLQTMELVVAVVAVVLDQTVLPP
jgi:hypothetical protein